MKILLTGASGLLGRAVYKSLSESAAGFELAGTFFSRSSDNLIKLNLTDSSAVIKAVSDLSPDLIIHCAAERRPDVVKKNPADAEKLNVSAVSTLAEAAEARGAAILYLSTDYVFDGTNPPYGTEDEPNPLNTYGRMKLEGEIICLTTCSRQIILRLPILYGNVEHLGESAVTVIAENITYDKPSFHDDEAVRYPTHTEDIAEVITGMAERLYQGEDISGIYHWSAETPYTKYEIALVMAEALGIDKNLIQRATPDPDAAPRPLDAHLDTSRLRMLGLGRETGFVEAITEVLSGF
ncbi:MAG: SDR family oxidoreductase [Spirochaetales bacterium]|nr:SDR family oxidoreductase [Spirochaetales bacterium]